jgi:hypothetical protein
LGPETKTQRWATAPELGCWREAPSHSSERQSKLEDRQETARGFWLDRHKPEPSTAGEVQGGWKAALMSTGDEASRCMSWCFSRGLTFEQSRHRR